MRGRGTEDGLTLVELLLAITLLGLIGGPLIGAIFVSLQSTSSTLSRTSASGGSKETAQDQLVTSHEQQQADAWFSSDAQSSAAVTKTPAAPSCVTLLAGDVPVVSFAWDESTGGAPTRRQQATYFVRRPAGAPVATTLGTLHRLTCARSLDGSPVPASVDVVVLRSVGPVAPSVLCDSTVLATTCASTTKTVAMQVKLGLAVPTPSWLTFSVQGQRRLT